MNHNADGMKPVLVRPATAARMLDCSRTTVHRLIMAGRLETVKVGSDRRITIASIERLAAEATQEAA